MHCTTGHSHRTIDGVWRQLTPAMTRAARRLTHDADEQRDLLQEAMIKLWEVDPTRFDLKQTAELRYLRRVLVNRMWKVQRAELRRGLTG
jgi:DNA-directed RNA polymerase specialized sigma24 family protein